MLVEMCNSVHLPSLSWIVTVVTRLNLSICTFGSVVDRVTVKISSSSAIESSLVAMAIISSVLPAPKLKSVEESRVKSSSLAFVSETVALNFKGGY